VSCSGDSAEKYDFCDSVLKYIDQVLMEDDMEDKASMFEDSTLKLLRNASMIYLMKDILPCPIW